MHGGPRRLAPSEDDRLGEDNGSNECDTVGSTRGVPALPVATLKSRRRVKTKSSTWMPPPMACRAQDASRGAISASGSASSDPSKTDDNSAVNGDVVVVARCARRSPSASRKRLQCLSSSPSVTYCSSRWRIILTSRLTTPRGKPMTSLCCVRVRADLSGCYGGEPLTRENLWCVVEGWAHKPNTTVENRIQIKLINWCSICINELLRAARDRQSVPGSHWY
jgi:hypothetical protein